MENKVDERVEIIEKIVNTKKNIEKLKESYEDAIQLGENSGIANTLKVNIEIYEEELEKLEEDRIKIGEQLKEKKNMYEKTNETILGELHKTKEQIELFSYLNEFDEEREIAEKNKDGEYIAGSIQANREKKLEELNEKFTKLEQVYDKNYDKNTQYIKEIEKTLKLLGIEEELAEENQQEEQKEDENEQTQTEKDEEKLKNEKIKELNDKKKEYEAENEIYKEKIEKLQNEEKELTDIAQKNMISTDNETQKNQTNLLRNISRIRQDIKFYNTKIEQNNKQIEKINNEIDKLVNKEEIVEKGRKILDDMSTDYMHTHIKNEENKKSKQPSNKNENVLAELTEEELNALLSSYRKPEKEDNIQIPSNKKVEKENIFKNIFKNTKNGISNFFNNIKLGFRALTGKTKLIEEAKKIDINKTERVGNEILDKMKSDYKNVHFNVEPLSIDQLKNNIDRKPETLYREDEEIPKEQLEGLENIGHDGLVEIKTEKEENKPRLDIETFDNSDGHIEKNAIKKQKESEKQKKYDDLFNRMFEAAKEK